MTQRQDKSQADTMFDNTWGIIQLLFTIMDNTVVNGELTQRSMFVYSEKKQKQLLYFTWLAARHLVKALDVLMNDGEICVKRKIPSVRCTWVYTELLSSSGVCTAHVQQKLFVIICMLCHQVFSLYLQKCWGWSEPGINITLRESEVKLSERLK